ncbi:hypothetical protein MY11210_008201 [Beauveria gryllotalpidicola]
MHFSVSAKSFGLLALALPLSVTAQRSFDLFAYGTDGGVSAASMFYENGNVMLSNLTDPPNLTPIYFTRDSNNPSPWIIQPNKTVSSDPPFTSGYLALQSSTDWSLAKIGNSSADALDLQLFGQSLFARINERMQNPFYALDTNTTGIWQLVWDPEDTHQDQLEPVIMRPMRPPRPDGRN